MYMYHSTLQFHRNKIQNLPHKTKAQAQGTMLAGRGELPSNNW